MGITTAMCSNADCLALGLGVKRNNGEGRGKGGAGGDNKNTGRDRALDAHHRVTTLFKLLVFFFCITSGNKCGAGS